MQEILKTFNTYSGVWSLDSTVPRVRTRTLPPSARPRIERVARPVPRPAVRLGPAGLRKHLPAPARARARVRQQGRRAQICTGCDACRSTIRVAINAALCAAERRKTVAETTTRLCEGFNRAVTLRNDVVRNDGDVTRM